MDSEQLRNRKSTDICRGLLGKELLRREGDGSLTGGVVVEAEAYIGVADPAAHLSGGITQRNLPFFRGPGNIYIFKIHGHDNLNLSSTYSGHPECILIRALQPTRGVERMRDRRGFEEETELCSGPGRLTEALDLEKERHNDTMLEDSCLEIRDTGREPEVEVTERIGVSGAEDWPLRFIEADNPHVSKNREPRDPELDDKEEAFRWLEQTRPPEPPERSE